MTIELIFSSDSLKKRMANHFSILALRTPWTVWKGKMIGLKEELPRSVSAQYATGDQWRNNSRKNEGMEPKQKQQDYQFSSVAQSCPTICNPTNHSTPGLPVHHHLLEFSQSHIHRVGDAIQPSHPLSSPFPPAPNPSQHSESFPMSQLFAWGGQSTGVSALASFLPKNTQDWPPLEWTGWISLQSKGLSRVSSNTTVEKHQFFGTQLSS